MKFVYFVLLVCISLCNADENLELYKELKAGCLSETGLSEESADKAKEGDFTDPKIGAYLHCFMKSGGFVDPSGKYIPEMIKLRTTGLFGEEVGNKIVDECVKESHGVGEEAAISFAKCFHQHAPKHDGLK